jgi:RNA ligase
MKLYDLLDKEKLDHHIREGFVSVTQHPSQPLIIFNYTPRAAFAGAWGDGTLDYCRGLIVNQHSEEIVARPFKKFHNLNTQSMPETMAENLPPSRPEITQKMDGSLGIWYDDGTPEGAIATRGSFTSPQALWATKWWKKQFIGPWLASPAIWREYWTPLFEIIYPENRVVVDYGGYAGLTCIGGVYIETGLDVSRWELEKVFGSHVVEKAYARTKRGKFRLDHPLTLAACAKQNIPNEEGYVASYDQGRLRVKIKFADYVKLHRIITGVNPRSLWELLSTNEEFDKTGLPANFVAWAEKWENYLWNEFNRIQTEAVELFGDRPFREAGETERYYRAKFARFVMAQTKDRDYLKPVLFDMFDGYDGNRVIWRMLEPAGNDMRFSTSGIDATEGE